MLLAVDAGNTTISVGIFKRNKLISISKILTRRPASLKYYYAAFKKIIKNKNIEDVIISSVVPEVTAALKKIFRQKFNLKPIILGEDLRVPIKNLYKNPKQVGQDRLVNAYAGYRKFGGGLIIVDFGTAVTFDIISKKGEYLGGIIVPGLEVALNALSEKAALLPRIKLKRPKSLIGKDTVTSMRSGILNGYGALCDGLVDRIKKEVGRGYKIILTGGHSKIISKYCNFDKIEPNLTLEGLRLIFSLALRRRVFTKAP